MSGSGAFSLIAGTGIDFGTVGHYGTVGLGRYQMCTSLHPLLYPDHSPIPAMGRLRLYSQSNKL